MSSTVGPGNRLVSDGTYFYQYDAEGNLISRSKIANGDTLTFTWDHRNRLTEIAESWSGVTSGPTFDLKYDYDLFDR
ncbi:MAG: RHS repeat protein, partial [Planctomycetia bacterium]|nr:RHS repeat protein [Planctomycetia bacterium]